MFTAKDAAVWQRNNLRETGENGFHPAVRFGSFAKFWLPVLIWMALIFVGSGDTLSGQHTSRILVPLYHWLMPWLSPESVDAAAFYTRKLGHLCEYGVLALLIWRALRKPERGDARPWSWTMVRFTVLLAAGYAASDEFHQSFVSTREARVHDVVIDTCGATAALLLLWFIGGRRGQW